jgi:hypothetical protein
MNELVAKNPDKEDSIIGREVFDAKRNSVLPVIVSNFLVSLLRLIISRQREINEPLLVTRKTSSRARDEVRKRPWSLLRQGASFLRQVCEHPGISSQRQ